MYNKKILQILLDSGSTHNFLDLNMARKLGCKPEEVKPMSTTGGSGHQLEALFLCKGFTWSIHNQEYVADVIVLPLVCRDLILGVQWLKSLGPILWDFDRLQMKFTISGRKILLRGADICVKLISNEALNTTVDEGAELCFLQFDQDSPQIIIPSCSVYHQGDTDHSTLKEIELLIEQYPSIFKEHLLSYH